MPERRMINSKIWEDEFVGSLTFFERLLWIGLIVSVADDQGRMPYNPAIIRARVLLYDENVTNEKIAETIQNYVEAGKLTRYTDKNGRELIQINNWWRHQSLQWPQASKHKAPDGWTDRERYHTTGRKIVTRNMELDGGYCTPDALPSGLPSELPSAIEESRGEESRGEQSSKELASAALADAPETFDQMQVLVETITGYPSSGSDDVKAINEMLKLNIIRADLEDALAFLTKRGKMAYGPAGVLGSAKTARARRVQKINSKQADQNITTDEQFRAAGYDV